jgi:replication factor C small subunit
MEIWTEKYRPEKISDIVGQENITEKLKNFMERGNVPNMLFAGPPGCGKTTAAIAIAHELFGKNWYSNFLELNASDERGIDVVRHKIKDFARIKPIATKFKVICLDEADSLTPDAQHALRRTMEKYSETTRFVLICNYSNRIIEPIQSRCAVFRFKTLGFKEMGEQVKKVSIGEGMEIDDNTVTAIIDSSDGDMRRAINILQSIAGQKDLSDKTVYEMVNSVRPGILKNILQLAIVGKFLDSRALLLGVIRDGATGEDIIRGMCKQVFALDLPEVKKAKLIQMLGQYEWRIARGGTPQIQLEAFLGEMVGLE